MTSDDCTPTSEPPVQAAQASSDPPSMHRENSAVMNQPQSSNPLETPTPPPLNTTRAPDSLALPEGHQISLRRVQTLESHNAKLYEDNCKLVNAVNTLNERLAFSAAPQNTQLLRLADMQERLRASEASRAHINQKYQELLQCTSAGTAQRHINQELQAVREGYAVLDREYRLLADKYARLKAIIEANRVPQQQPQGTVRSLVPVGRSEAANTTQFRGHDQTRNSYASPASPGSCLPFSDLKRNHRRPSSESVMVQPSLRSGPTPMATTWLGHLPTPPPSASLLATQVSPTFPVHAPVPAGSLPLPHHSQMTHDQRIISGLPAVTQCRPLVQQGTPEQIDAVIHPRQRCNDIKDTTNIGPVTCGKQTPAPVTLTSSPRRPSKRPSSESQTSVSPGGEHKKPRKEGEVHRPTTTDADTCPADKILSPPASTDPRDDRKLPVSDSNTRSYQDCVNLIFEKDANVDDGVFCGLCLDRHEAKMIPEPPDVLIQPDFDFLVRHCMTMHPTVWDDLRRRV